MLTQSKSHISREYIGQSDIPLKIFENDCVENLFRTVKQCADIEWRPDEFGEGMNIYTSIHVISPTNFDRAMHILRLLGRTLSNEQRMLIDSVIYDLR